MPLKPLVAVFAAALVLAFPSIASPQAPPAPRSCGATLVAQLDTCFAPGERIRVRTTGGEAVSGAFRGIVDGAILIETDEVRVVPYRAFAEQDVEDVARLRKARGEGIAGGAAGWGFLGLGFVNTARSNGEAVGIVAAFAALGALLGALGADEVPDVVFIRHRGSETPPLVRSAPEPTAPLAAAAALPAVATRVAELTGRVQVGERIRVMSSDDVMVIGGFSRAVGETLFVSIRGREVEVAERDIRTVERKSPRARRVSRAKGALIGAGVCLSLVSLGWALSSDEERAAEPLTASDIAVGSATCAAGGALLVHVFGRSKVEVVMFRQPADARAPRTAEPGVRWTWAF